MNYIKKLIILVLLFNSCSGNKQEETSILKEDNLELEMIETYKEGVKALEEGDVLYATKKFNESELLYPQSSWAPKSSLMASYAYYSYGYFSDSVYELKRFIKLYSKHENLDYAYYLLAMNYYDSIVDEKKDLRPLVEAKKNFRFIIVNYPNTDFALDAKYKLDLIHDILAAKEMFIARHYMKKEKWIAAINRFKKIINDYNSTIYVEEALHRLVEIHYKIGLLSESKKYANTLGYNYLSSEWYKESYRVFNKDYEIQKKVIKKTKRRKLIEKIKSFF
jgi:outer membrane protein assembly factor BamD